MVAHLERELRPCLLPTQNVPAGGLQEPQIMSNPDVSHGSGNCRRDPLMTRSTQEHHRKSGELRFSGGEHPSATLILPDSGVPNEKIALDQRPMELGRSPLADLHLDDHCVSRRHCELVAAEDGLMVQDIGSTQGTYVNDEAVERQLLHDGDTLTVGSTHLVVTFDEQTDTRGRAASSAPANGRTQSSMG